MPAAVASSNLWVHTEPAGLVRAIADGYDYGLAGDWARATLPERVRALHGLLIETAALQARLVGTVTEAEAEGYEVLIDPRPRPGAPADRLAAARILYRTWQLVAIRAQQRPLMTEGPSPDVGALPAVAVVAVVLIGSAAVAYCAHQAAVVVDRELAREADLQQLARVHTTSLQLVRDHVEREGAAGSTLPLDAATVAVLQGLQQTQATIAEKTEEPLPPLGGAAQSLGRAAEKAAPSAGKWFGLSAGVLAAVGAALVWHFS
jgi:hypothetical protein